MTDIELIKSQIVAQLDDYERAIAEFAAFMEARRPKLRLPLYSEEARTDPAKSYGSAA